MNRRGFLAFLGGATALALDPERALWVPGARLISIPPAANLRISAELEGYASGLAYAQYERAFNEAFVRYTLFPPLVPIDPHEFAQCVAAVTSGVLYQF